MGPIKKPIEPIAWRQRQATAEAKPEVGLVVIRTGDVFWAASYSECYKKAQAAGYKV